MRKGSGYRPQPGTRFGKLTVVREAERQYHLWCRCDCGNECSVNRYSLKRGDTTTCGCSRSDKEHLARMTAKAREKCAGKYSRTLWYDLWREYKRGAMDRNLAFEITEDDLRECASKDCSYCGRAPLKRVCGTKWRRLSGEHIYCNGADRIDNARGYTVDNITPCCKHCNRLKWTMDTATFLERCKAVADWNSGREKATWPIEAAAQQCGVIVISW